MKKDKVDTFMEQWKEELPELGTESMAVLGRLNRVAKHIEKRLGKNFSQYNLNSGEFDVLATLRRSGKDYRLKPTDLYQSLMITSGAMTNRIDTLEKKELVSRTHDDSDRRTIYVQLTKKGYDLITEAVVTHTKTENSILKDLSKKETVLFNDLLKKLLFSLGEEPQEYDTPNA
jgi:DNA-binding MarR family transcriptional regulator